MKRGYYYLAQEYTNYSAGHDGAFELACRVAGKLMRSGKLIFSPIAHSHPIVPHAEEADTRDNWLTLDKMLLLNSRGLIIIDTPDWRDSDGVQRELIWAVHAGLHVWMYDVLRNELRSPYPEDLKAAREAPEEYEEPSLGDVDIVFDGPPDQEAGRFVEVENHEGSSINIGTWVHRPDGFWVLRIPLGGGEDMREKD